MTTYNGNVSNGNATVTISTTNMEEGKYLLKTRYPQNNKYNNAEQESILTLTQRTSTIIGKDTNTPFNDNMKRGGIINNEGVLFTSYTCNPMILNSIVFSSDFEMELKMGMDCVGGTYYFGFTTNPTSVASELQINNTNMNNDNNASYPNLFTNSYQTETIRIQREGNQYTLTHNNNSTSITVNNPQPVYLYCFKTGNCSIYIETIEYTGGGN